MIYTNVIVVDSSANITLAISTELCFLFTNTFNNELTTWIKNKLLKKHVIALFCCHCSREGKIYETRSYLHRFLILYIEDLT